VGGNAGGQDGIRRFRHGGFALFLGELGTCQMSRLQLTGQPTLGVNSNIERETDTRYSGDLRRVDMKWIPG